MLLKIRKRGAEIYGKGGTAREAIIRACAEAGITPKEIWIRFESYARRYLGRRGPRKLPTLVPAEYRVKIRTVEIYDRTSLTPVAAYRRACRELGVVPTAAHVLPNRWRETLRAHYPTDPAVKALNPHNARKERLYRTYGLAVRYYNEGACGAAAVARACAETGEKLRPNWARTPSLYITQWAGLLGVPLLYKRTRRIGPTTVAAGDTRVPPRKVRAQKLDQTRKCP